MDSQGALSSAALSARRNAGLSTLAFAATMQPGVHRIDVVCGTGVETSDQAVVAGAWVGDFGRWEMERAATSIGTGLALTPEGLLGIVGTASASALYYCRVGQRLTVANTLALALAAADDDLVTSEPFYANDMATFVVDDPTYRNKLRTRRGTLSVFYGTMRISPELRVAPMPAPAPPGFPDFATYRAYLVEQVRGVFANADDPRRGVRYRPIASVSAGYDSPAAAAIACEAGCGAAFTFGQPHDRTGGNDDSGAAVAQALGLELTEYRTHGYRQRDDLPEVEFIASSFTGGQVYLASAGGSVRERIVVSGYGGDRVWDPKFGRVALRSPFSIGGYSQNEFFARQPALDFAVPMIGAANARDIGAISRSAAMAAWSVGGDYDRPIPRRIVEEAGVARGAFGSRKQRAAPDYDNFARRTLDLAGFLTPTALQAFEDWMAREQPIPKARAMAHGVLLRGVGPLLWSNKLRRTLRRRGIEWPPFASRWLRFKVPIRRNAYVFNWAVAEQVRRHRRALAQG